jgi:hypothetical protein
MANEVQPKATAGAIQIIRAQDVSVPVMPNEGKFSPEIERLRDDFLNGKDVSRFDLQRIVEAAAEGGGNGNCSIC